MRKIGMLSAILVAGLMLAASGAGFAGLVTPACASDRAMQPIKPIQEPQVVKPVIPMPIAILVRISKDEEKQPPASFDALVQGLTQTLSAGNTFAVSNDKPGTSAPTQFVIILSGIPADRDKETESVVSVTILRHIAGRPFPFFIGGMHFTMVDASEPTMLEGILEVLADVDSQVSGHDEVFDVQQ